MESRKPTLLLALPVVLALGAGCPPSIDDDDVADDDAADDDDASLDCADPADPPPSVTDCGMHEDLPDADWNWASFRSEDGNVEVLIVREWEMQGAGFSTIWGLRGFAAMVDGCLVCVDDADALDYESTHHNWVDKAWAGLADQELEIYMPYQPEDDPMEEWTWRYLFSGLSIEDRTTVLWGPVDLLGWQGMIPPA